MREKPRPDWYRPATGSQEFYTDERCYITELCNDDDVPTSLALARVEPKVTTQLHALEGVTETYVIRQGEGLVEVGGTEWPVTVGDRVVIQAGSAQRITNTGQHDLEFYCICAPGFFPDCYVNLEKRHES